MNEGVVTSATRRSKRFIPGHPVTVVMSKNGSSFMYGVVANISEDGACFKTSVLPPHQILDLVLIFSDSEYVSTTGRIVWSDSAEGAATIEVEFIELTSQERQRLRSNLDSRTFTQL
jgi:PilZ domain